ARNLDTQCLLQKKYFLPPCSTVPAAFAGSTVMPQTGSIAIIVSRLLFAPRDETDADIERIAHPQTAVEGSEGLDAELRLVDAESRDHYEHVVLPQYGRGEAQIARHSTERDACGDRRTPLRTDEGDRLDPDERMLLRVEHVPSEHVLAGVAARGLRDLGRKFVAFLGARCARIHREGIAPN